MQINAGPVKEIIIRISKALSYISNPAVKQKANNNTLVFRFESEIQPVVPLKLKVEINCREHFHILGLTKIRFDVHNQWFTGECQATTYMLDELLGTKLRALYQRRKGRDLYDLYKALSTAVVNADNIVLCYNEYMKRAAVNPPSMKEFQRNVELKMQDEDFLSDMKMLLRVGEQYDPQQAFEVVKSPY